MSIASAPGWVKAFAAGATVGAAVYTVYTLANNATAPPSRPASASLENRSLAEEALKSPQTNPARNMGESEANMSMSALQDALTAGVGEGSGGESELWEDVEGEEEELDADGLKQVHRALVAAALPGVAANYIEVLSFPAGAGGMTVTREFKCFGSADKAGEAKALQLEKRLTELASNLEFVVQLGSPPCPNPKVWTVGDVGGNRLWATGAERDLLPSKKDGRLIFLEFWATWCGPCAGIMAHTKEMLSRRVADWEGDCEVVALSIDEEVDAVKAWIANEGSKHTTYLWAGDGQNPGHVAKVFDIEGIPMGMFVRDGHILWQGHPMELDLEASIDALLSGGAVVRVVDEDGPEGLFVGEVEGVPLLESYDEWEYLDLVDQLQERFQILPPHVFPGLMVVCSSHHDVTKDGVRALRNIVVCGEGNASDRPEFEELFLKWLVGRISGRIGVAIRWHISASEPEAVQACNGCNVALGQDSARYQCMECSFAACTKCQDAKHADHPGTHGMYALPPGSSFTGVQYGVENLNIAAGPSAADLRHLGVECDGCSSSFFTGNRYKCAVCKDFDFCPTCYSHLQEASGLHEHLPHAFLRYAFPNHMTPKDGR